MPPRKTKIVDISAESTSSEKSEMQKVEPVVEKETLIQKKLETQNSRRSTFLLGAGLLILGVIMLAGQLLNVRLGNFVWPFIFIVPGTVIFLSALSSESSSSEGFVVLGSILTMLGLVFLAQTVLDLWASWAYAWSLIAPTSIGIGQMIYGARKGRDGIVQTGKHLATIGLTMFAVGFIFFELVLNISNIGFARFGLPTLPMALILLGVIILARALLQKR